jgi:hypothetical protein
MLLKTPEQFNNFIIKTRTLPSGVDKPTPYSLVQDMISQIPESVWENRNSTIIDPSFGFGTYLHAACLKLRLYHSEEHVLKNMLYGVEIDPFRYKLTKYNLGIQNLILADFLLWKTDMKFDVIVGNPPYQMVTDGNSNPIWDRFVVKYFEHIKKDGYILTVHPAGWRNVTGRFNHIRDLILSKELKHLEIYNTKAGIKTFGANTRYDWYLVKNTDCYTNKTEVAFEDGTLGEFDLRELPFIPNHSLDNITSLIARPREERVEVLHSYSSYETRKPHVSKTQTEEFKYPVIYHVSRSTGPTFQWSSRNDLGHFGIPKIIWGRSARTGFYLDIDGKYGLTEFAYAILDTPENLEKIIKILDENYDELASMTNVTGSGINHKVLGTFRKDFWKEFV